MSSTGILSNSFYKHLCSLVIIMFAGSESVCPAAIAAPARICQSNAAGCEKDDLNSTSKNAGSQSKTIDEKKSVKDWFSKYDSIRREAQMSPKEKGKADRYLHRGFAILIPGFGRFRAHNLIKTLIKRYKKASSDLEKLPEIEETSKLREAYIDFFNQSHSVFKDCNKLLINPFAYNKKNGFLKKSIKERHKKLKSMEADAKGLDQKRFF